MKEEPTFHLRLHFLLISSSHNCCIEMLVADLSFHTNRCYHSSRQLSGWNSIRDKFQSFLFFCLTSSTLHRGYFALSTSNQTNMSRFSLCFASSRSSPILKGRLRSVLCYWIVRTIHHSCFAYQISSANGKNNVELQQKITTFLQTKRENNLRYQTNSVAYHNCKRTQHMGNKIFYCIK